MISRQSSSSHRYRRRLSSTFAIVAAVVTAALVLHVSGASRELTRSPFVTEVDTAMLRSNMRHWTIDYAVIFYAPWCQHCQEMFLPLWQQLAMALADEDPKGKKKLVWAKFNCEQDATAMAFCHEIELTHYPSFHFYGSGKFHDHDPLLGVFQSPPTVHESSARFVTDVPMFYEQVHDWVMAMHFVSGSNRFMEKINIFGGSRRSKEERLNAEIEFLQQQNNQLQQAITGSGTAGQSTPSAKVYGHGDVFQELEAVNWDEQFDHVIYCVQDLAAKYCALEEITDDWCETTGQHCAAVDWFDEICWPSRCPLKQQGCEVLSHCLTPEMWELYSSLLSQLELQTELGGGMFEATTETGVTLETRGKEDEGAEQAEAGDSAGPPPFLPHMPRMDRPAEDGRGEIAATS